MKNKMYKLVWGGSLILTLLMILSSFLMPELLDIAQLFLGMVFLGIFMRALFHVRTSKYTLIRTWNYAYMCPAGIIALSMFMKGVMEFNLIIDLIWLPMALVLILTGWAYEKSLHPIFKGEMGKYRAKMYSKQLRAIETAVTKKYTVKKKK